MNKWTIVWFLLNLALLGSKGSLQNFFVNPMSHYVESVCCWTSAVPEWRRLHPISQGMCSLFVEWDFLSKQLFLWHNNLSLSSWFSVLQHSFTILWFTVAQHSTKFLKCIVSPNSSSFCCRSYWSIHLPFVNEWATGRSRGQIISAATAAPSDYESHCRRFRSASVPSMSFSHPRH